MSSYAITLNWNILSLNGENILSLIIEVKGDFDAADSGKYLVEVCCSPQKQKRSPCLICRMQEVVALLPRFLRQIQFA